MLLADLQNVVLYSWTGLQCLCAYDGKGYAHAPTDVIGACAVWPDHHVNSLSHGVVIEDVTLA